MEYILQIFGMAIVLVKKIYIKNEKSGGINEKNTPRTNIHYHNFKGTVFPGTLLIKRNGFVLLVHV